MNILRALKPWTRAQLLPLLLLVACPAHAGSGEDAVSPAPAQPAITLPVAPAVEREAPQISLRPGDVLYISLPGEDTLNRDFQVERDGRVVLPEIGAFSIDGLTLDDARTTLKDKFARIYRDVERFDLVLRERRLLLSVLGYVEKPGSVELPQDATVQTAVNSAGGLLSGAQLDRLQLRRGGEVTTFDYKHYLDSGDIGALPELRSLDVIFVPASPLTGNVQAEFDASTLSSKGDAGEDETAVKVFGEVNNPGSYAFREGASVVDMLMRAGSVTRFAGVEKIRVISDGREPSLFDLKTYLDTGSQDLQPALQPGATIFVPAQSEDVKSGARTVYVMGEVFKPGSYESDADPGFLDVLANAGGPTRFADSRQIRVLHVDGRVSRFDLVAHVESGKGESVPLITPGDAIFVPERQDKNDESWLAVGAGEAVRVIGAVRDPGRFEWDDSMTLLDLLAQAGGPSGRADTAHVQILGDATQERPGMIDFDLDAYVRSGGTSAPLPVVRAGFTVVIPELPQDPNDNKSQWVRQPAENSIYVFGQVGSPGRYAFNSNLNFVDILSAADGPTGTADIHNIRVTHRDRASARVSKLNLALYFETGDETLLPVVRPGDTIYIPEKGRDWLDQDSRKQVRVLGSVHTPGAYAFDSSKNLVDLLAEAGGTTPTALTRKIVVVHNSCCEQTSSSFDLRKFAKTGDVSLLPPLRAGDTVYVPDREQGGWNQFMSGVKDVLSIASILAIAGVL